ncbi:MAG: hypothetical protein KJ063_25570 [Anaerolineae bacterium]|nr:hypothetical protein [Anaerolineae bacterium]
MVKYSVFKLMMSLATIGLAACGTGATPASSHTPTPTTISIEATILEPPPTNALALTPRLSSTAVPPINTPESAVALSPTPAPTATPLPDPDPVASDDPPFTRVSNTAVNLHFSYPDEWLVENDNMGNEIGYLIASSDALLDGLDADESGSAIRISIGDTENWISNAKDQRRAIEGLVTLYESVAVENIDFIQAPTSLRINGLEAATTSFHINDDISSFMSLTFILSGEQSVTVIGVASADKEAIYVPILEVITESIYVLEDLVAHQLATRPIPFLFRYPASWDWRPIGDNRIIVGMYDVILTGELGDEAMHIIDWVDFGYMIPPQDLLKTLPDPFTTVERGEVIKEAELITINGQEAAQIAYNGRYLDNDVILIYTVIAAEPYMLISFGIAAVANQNILVPIHTAITDSIVLQEGFIDFENPASVVEAIFIAARTEEFGILPYLCDPHGEADEDVKGVCAISPEHEQRDEFIQYFATAGINGEIVIDGNSAFVSYVFGPNKDQTETMELIRRNQLWYLLRF